MAPKNKINTERKPNGGEEIIKKKVNDVEKLYQNYIRYQAGDKSALGELFKETGKNVGETNRIQELEEEYKLSHTDNILDAGLIESEIRQRQEERKCKVVFAFQCLNNMANKAKWNYSEKYINTGYENGKRSKNKGYKKYHEGEYDVTDLEEIMQEIVIKVFQGKVSGSKVDIVDGTTLLQNIKYYLSREIESNNKIIYRNIPEMGIDNRTGEEISYFDQYAEKEWISSGGQISRLLLYADCLKWLQKNDLHNLFNISSYDIHAIINTILKFECVFEEGESGCLQLINQESLKNMITRTIGRNIEERNISVNFKLIEQRLLDHLLYSLNYKIGKAPRSNGGYKKESERFLYEHKKKAYFKLFTRENMKIFALCNLYIDIYIDLGKCQKESFLESLREYKSIIVPILEKVKGRKKYDMVNLITGDYDVISERLDIVLLNIIESILQYLQHIEISKIIQLEKQYNILNKCSDKKYKYWEVKLSKKYLNIKLWSRLDIKKPIHCKIDRENLMVFEGYRNIYLFDCGNSQYYTFIKKNRVISKSDHNHKILFYNIA